MRQQEQAKPHERGRRTGKFAEPRVGSEEYQDAGPAGLEVGMGQSAEPGGGVRHNGVTAREFVEDDVMIAVVLAPVRDGGEGETGKRIRRGSNYTGGKAGGTRGRDDAGGRG